MRNRLRFHFAAEFQLDSGRPTWAAAVLKDIRLPRWTYEGHDRGAAGFVRVRQKTALGWATARLWLRPLQPMPIVWLDIDVEGHFSEADEGQQPPPGFGGIIEEAEALLVLLGCRSPKFFLEERYRITGWG